MVKSSADRIAAACPNGSAACKFTGVRRRKWGKFVSEIRLPNSRERIWLGSYDTAEKAARAFDAAQFCLRGRGARLNFPDNLPEIPNARSMTPAQIQVAAARFAHSGRVGDPDSQSDLLSLSEEVSQSAAQRGCEITGVPLDVDPVWEIDMESYAPELGVFSGFEEFAGDFYMPPPPATDYWVDSNEEMVFSGVSSFIWDF